jgi:hypothetical protein
MKTCTSTVPPASTEKALSYITHIRRLAKALFSAVILSALAFPGAITAQTNCAALPSGLVGWWQANGNANDIAYGNNGILDSNVTYETGEVGEGFVLPGNAGIMIGNPTNLQIQTLTIEAWIKRNSTFQTSNPDDEFACGFLFGFGPGGYGFGIEDGGSLLFGQVDLSASVSTNAVITDTNFHHVAVTSDAGAVVFYVDGKPYPAPFYNPEFSFTTSAALGMLGAGISQYPPESFAFWGTIDELSIYNKALSSNDIKDIFLAGSFGKCVTVPPYVASQPTNITVSVSNTATLTVLASGAEPLFYHWRQNGTNVPGATNATLEFLEVQPANAGNYSVLVSNQFGMAVSSNAVLGISLTPIIITQPISQAFFSNQPVTLSVAIAGTVPENYQWTFDGANIDGATNSVLTISNAQINQAGTYAAIVGTEPNATTSASVVLGIRLDEAYLTNLLAAGGTVTLPDSLFVLTNTITINNDLVLDGTGHSVTISGGGAVRMFELPGGFHLTLRNLTFSNASVAGTGGAIFSQGILDVENCQFVSNTVSYPVNLVYGALDGGGAIYSAGALTVSNSTFIGNSATGGGIGPGGAKGGAIFNDGGWLNLIDAVFSGNTAIGAPGNSGTVCHDCPPFANGSGGGSGGAIYSSSGTVVASNLFVSGNSAICPGAMNITFISVPLSPATGGAICVATGNALLENSIFSNNLAIIEPGFGPTYLAPGAGGSIYNAGFMVLSNCAILDSVATNGVGEDTMGGGAYNSGAMVIDGTLISGNSVGSLAIPGIGGGIYNAGSAQIIDCTVSNNVAPAGSGGGIASGGITTLSNTIIFAGDASGTNVISIGIYNSGGFQSDGSSFLIGMPVVGPGFSFEWQLNGTNIQGAVSNTLNLGTVQFSSNGTYSLLVSNSSGVSTNFAEIVSSPAISVPTFILQPIGEITNVGTTVEFQAVAVGFPAPTYQWRFDGTNLPGATESALTFLAATAAQSGNYSVLASNLYGAITSQVVALVLENTNIVPGITEIQPPSQVVIAGTNVLFSVTSPGKGVTYQWLKNGTALIGQTNSTLGLTNVNNNDDGAYSIELSSPGENVTGGTAFLSVITGPPTIVAQPQDASLGNNGPVVLSVGVAGGSVANAPEVASGKLQLWLKADAGTVVTGNGHVIQWQDESGNNNTAIQLNTNAQPSIVYPSSLGGLAAIRFGGAQGQPNGEYLAGSGTVGDIADMTSFMVYDVSTSAIPQQVAFFTGVPGSINGGRGDILESGEMAFTTWGETFNSGDLVPTNSYRIWSDRISENQTHLEFFDDTLDSSSNFAIAITPQAPPGPGYYVGGVDPTLANVGTGDNFAGDIAELMVYDGALSDSDRLAILSYLKQKYYQINPAGISYQWVCNGTNVPGATNATLVFAAGQPAQTGVYNVVVSNQLGAVVSSNAMLSVSPSSRVVSVLDEGSLELALEEGGQITFTTNGTILLTNTITLDADAIIDGTGHSITLSGGGATRLFNVPEGFSLTLRNLTLANAVGSAVINAGNLTLENCVFTNNVGPAGGAINNAADLTVSNCVFVNNSVSGGNAYGGAIYNYAGSMRLYGVTFSNNFVISAGPGSSIVPFQPPPSRGGDAAGAALYSTNGIISAADVFVISNTASSSGDSSQFFPQTSVGPAGAALGAGFCLAGGTAVISDSVFSNNAATAAVIYYAAGGNAQGAAIWTSADLTMTNTVLAGNQVTGSADFAYGASTPGQGGALFNAGSLSVVGSVISSNVATGGMTSTVPSTQPGLGGAIYNTAVAEISSSTITGNLALGGIAVFCPACPLGGPQTITNYGTGEGGAIVNTGFMQTENTIFSNNSTAFLGAYGEAIYNTGAFVVDSNTIVFPNSTGTPPLTYAWQFNGTNIAGATTSAFALTSAQFENEGSYSLLISNSTGLVTNFVEILNLPMNSAPTFVLQPVGEVTNLGATVEFDAAATGFPAPAYQWSLDGTNIAGATDSALVLTNVLQNQSGAYTVVASNYLGSATNQPAILTVQPGLLLTGFQLGSSGFRLNAEGMAGMNVILEVSTNLLEWLPLQTNASPMTFLDTNAIAKPARFYRLVLAP